MGLGQVGPDGKVGGRLERELEVFENVVRGKRKGYREKVKARESGASNLAETKTGDDGNEGGEREAKRARLEDEEDDGQTPNQRQGATGDKTAMPAQQSPPHSSTMPPPPRARATNGAMSHLPNDDTIPDDDLGDEHDDHAEDEEGDEARSEDDEDEDQAEEEDEDEDEERRPDEDDLDGYGPDDQLRHDMNGGDDDDDGLGDESD